MDSSIIFIFLIVYIASETIVFWFATRAYPLFADVAVLVEFPRTVITVFHSIFLAKNFVVLLPL